MVDETNDAIALLNLKICCFVIFILVHLYLRLHIIYFLLLHTILFRVLLPMKNAYDLFIGQTRSTWSKSDFGRNLSGFDT